MADPIGPTRLKKVEWKISANVFVTTDALKTS